MWEYSDKVKDYFLHPRNAGVIKDANGIGEVGSLACGDALKLYLKIENNIIVDAKFQTFGCASAIASSSALTEMIIGKSVEEASKVTNKDIAKYLDGLPREKMHCSVMGEEALEAAIRNWKGEAAPDHIEGKIVCKCFGVSDEQIIKAIQENNLTTVEEVTNFTKAGGGCGDCLGEIQRILDAVLSGQAHHPGKIGDFRNLPGHEKHDAKADPQKLSNVQRMQKVMSVLNDIIKPRLQLDGGDIELVDIDGKDVFVALRGMCASCPSSKLTVEGVVQQALRENVEPDLVVKEAR